MGLRTWEVRATLLRSLDVWPFRHPKPTFVQCLRRPDKYRLGDTGIGQQ